MHSASSIVFRHLVKMYIGCGVVEISKRFSGFLKNSLVVDVFFVDFFWCEELFHTLGDPSLPAQVDFSRSYVDLWPGFGFAEVVSHVKETCSQKKRCELHHAFWMLDVHLLSKFALRQETEEHTVLRVPRIYLLLLSLKDPWKSSKYQQVAATVWVFVWKWQLSLCIASGAPRPARWAANTDDLRHVDSGDGILATRFPITVTVDYGCHDVPWLQKRYPRDHQLLSSKREKQIQADLGKCLKDLDGFWILMISTAHETRIFFPSPSLYPLSYDCTPRIHCLEPWTAWNHCTFKSFTRMGGRSYCKNGLEKLLYISKETSRNEIPKYRKII